ncbi:MAG: hypothetical protein ACRENU_03225 [Gemmatimonadaceae bacterium]
MSTSAVPLASQQWNDPRTLTLVREATERRARQLADSGLADYRATAHGYLTFLAQLGEGFRDPPQVVKADELGLQVYWRAPNLSKQYIVGRRDTTLLPTDIAYHRDHLGIVQNNFPAIIRLGDGDEVKDVPHPLSLAGMGEYDFALSDSLRITSPGRVINVFEVKVRPKNDREARVVGALYLDRDNAQVVRMALSFTRAAFKDKQLEDLFVVLENGIVGGQFWLPRRQEIEIRRTATWLDYPARGIIRGRWEIGDYQLNAGIPLSTFTGSEIVQAPPSVLREYKWTTPRILDSLPPDVRAVTAEEIRRVQAEVRELVRAQALQRARGSALAASGVSDFVQFNRVEGLALGGGLSSRLGSGFGFTGTGRYGLMDYVIRGRLELEWENASRASVRVYYANDFRDVGDVAERSRLVNSFAAQETGSDYTDPYATEHVGAGAGIPFVGLDWSLDVTRELQRALSVHATPAHGTFEPPVGAAPVSAWRAALRAERATTLGWFGIEYRGTAEVRFTATDSSTRTCAIGPCIATEVLRGALTLDVERPIGDLRLVARTIGAAATGTPLLAQELVFLGGPLSAPGFGYHHLVGDRAISQQLGLRLPVPFVSVPLGRFGRSPASATLEPHVMGAFLHQAPPGVLTNTMPVSPPAQLRPVTSGFYSSAGLSLITAFDLLRFDVSRGFRDGRWLFSFDVSRPFWGIL